MRLKSKYPEKIEYHSSSVWDGLTGGTATVSNDNSIVYGTPKTFGGDGKGVCPDELFVSSILGCLNNTFLDFQRKFEMDLKALSLKGKATAIFDGEGYEVIDMVISGEVIVGEDELKTGERCIELMKEYCHLTRTLKNCIRFEYNISVREE